MTAALVACGGSSSPPQPPMVPSAVAPAGPPTISGRERLGWLQSAASPDELAQTGFAIYVDGSRTVVADVKCTPPAEGTTFDCTGQLPPMANGVHTLQLSSFYQKDPAGTESAKSGDLQVTVAAIIPSSDALGSGSDQRSRALPEQGQRRAAPDPRKERR